MKILIIGGTRFIGRHLTRTALDRDHDVTLFHRGTTGAGLFEEATEIFGDRSEDIEDIEGRFDVAVDTCGYVPRDVRRSARHLQSRVRHYLFVSSVSVYRDLSRRGVDETAYVKTLEDPRLDELNPSTYGPLKTECEAVVTGHFDHRSLIVRPGVVAGPWDPTDRFNYWVWRVGQGGEVLAPGPPSADVQLLDVRDLADWLVRCLEADRTGTFNAAGERISFEQMLEVCRRATGSQATFQWVPPSFIHEMELDTGPRQMPLYNPEADGHKKGLYAIDSSRALEAGLRRRPLEQTARATWQWLQTRDRREWCAGLGQFEEEAILARYHDRHDRHRPGSRG